MFLCSAPPQFSPVQGVQARRVGQIKSGAKRQHIKGWEDGRNWRLRERGLRRDALRHSLRHRSAVSLVEIAAVVAPRDMAALIGGELILLKLTVFLSLLKGVVCDKIKRRQSERIAGAGSLSFFML